MVRLSRRSRRRPRSPRHRQDGRPYRAAVGAPDLLQPQNMGFGRLSWPAPPASPILPRRVRLPLQPPPHPARRLPLLAWHRRRPPALHLPNVDLTGSRGISLYWISLRDVDSQLKGWTESKWLLGWKDITSPTNERTL